MGFFSFLLSDVCVSCIKKKKQISNFRRCPFSVHFSRGQYLWTLLQLFKIRFSEFENQNIIYSCLSFFFSFPFQYATFSLRSGSFNIRWQRQIKNKSIESKRMSNISCSYLPFICKLNIYENQLCRKKLYEKIYH